MYGVSCVTIVTGISTVFHCKRFSARGVKMRLRKLASFYKLVKAAHISVVCVHTENAVVEETADAVSEYLYSKMREIRTT